MSFLGSEKNWISTPFYVRKYHHLWNLLNRSCIYASTLLTVIEAKEKKRKRKYARIKKMKQQIVAEKQTSDARVEDEVVSKVAKLVHDLVEKVHDDQKMIGFTDFSTSSHHLSQNLTLDSTDRKLIVASFNKSSYNYDSITDFNSSNNDSALGESNAFSDTIFSRVSLANENNDSACNTNDMIVSLPPPEGIMDGDICREEDYIISLRRRRGFCSSPKHEKSERVDENVDAHATNMLSDDFVGEELNTEHLSFNDLNFNDANAQSQAVKLSNLNPLLPTNDASSEDTLQTSDTSEVHNKQLSPSPSSDLSKELFLSETIVEKAEDHVGIDLIEKSDVEKEMEDLPIELESLSPILQSPKSKIKFLSSGISSFKVSQVLEWCELEIEQSSTNRHITMESTQFAGEKQDSVSLSRLTKEVKIETDIWQDWDFFGSGVGINAEGEAQKLQSPKPDSLSLHSSLESCKVLLTHSDAEQKRESFSSEVKTNCNTAVTEQKVNPVVNVLCPICCKSVTEKSINKHLDLCIGTDSKIKSLRNRSTGETKQKATVRTKKEKVVKEKLAMPNIALDNSERKSDAGAETEGDFLCRRSNGPPRIKKEDPIASKQMSLLPTGISKLKAALRGAIESSNAVKDLVLQTAVAESRLDKSVKSNSPSCAALVPSFGKISSNQKLQSPLLKSPLIVKMGIKRRKFEDSGSSDSDIDSDQEEENDASEEDLVPVAPTRRSTRSTRSRKSYKEIGSSDDEDQEQPEERHFHMKKRSRKKKEFEPVQNFEKVAGEMIEKSEHDTKTNKKENNLDSSNLSQCESSSEEECEVHGLSKEEIKELLCRKYHTPDASIVLHVKEDNDGTRHFYGMPVDPSQPKFFTGGVLREYQITGYQWLKLLYENGESGILADEMGLGKTVQCIALMCKLFKSGVKGPFLICGPTSTINNWVSEFKRFAPKISFMLYHGTSSERSFMRQFLSEKMKKNEQLVMITSYEILLRDRSQLNNYCWAYLILDEGHRVKNLKSKTFAELKCFPASCKLMLTGTPLQNNIAELWSLLNFIFPEVFDDVQVFEAWFAIESLQKNEKLLSMLHQILTPFVLRRVKSDVEVKIPPKREIVVSAPLGFLQNKFYRATVDKSILHLVRNKEYYNVTPGVADPDLFGWMPQKDNPGEERWTRSKGKGAVEAEKKAKQNDDDIDYVINVSLNNMMMQLRRCCNHPFLIQHPLKPGSDELLVDDTIVSTCGKMMLLDRMLPALKTNGHKVLMFSQMTRMLDLLQDYCDYRSYQFVRFDGSTRCEDRHQHIKDFNENADIFIFLLSTRAGGLGINLTAADTVIIYDSDWNPHNDIQAQDRCHRIGQEKPVVIYRLVSMGTIDQQIVERASLKRKLEKMVMHQEKFKGNLATELVNTEVISSEELLKILEAKTNISVVENKENVISDSDLRLLLDRSNMISSDKSSGNATSPISGSQVIPTAEFQIINETREEKKCV